MSKTSAGILLFRKLPTGVQVMLVHPGGPFWANKDGGAWTIPKGETGPNEDVLAAAKREFCEETGIAIEGEFLELGAFKQPSGKAVMAWACEGDFETSKLKSNTFSLEWPPKSGKQYEFPEVDRARWFYLADSLSKITKGQVPIIGAFAQKMGIKLGEIENGIPFDVKGQGFLF